MKVTLYNKRGEAINHDDTVSHFEQFRIVDRELDVHMHAVDAEGARPELSVRLHLNASQLEEFIMNLQDRLEDIQLEKAGV